MGFSQIGRKWQVGEVSGRRRSEESEGVGEDLGAADSVDLPQPEGPAAPCPEWLLLRREDTTDLERLHRSGSAGCVDREQGTAEGGLALGLLEAGGAGSCEQRQR